MIGKASGVVQPEEKSPELRDKHRWQEIQELINYKAFKVVPKHEATKGKRITTRFVDTPGKSRFVAREFNIFKTTDFFSTGSQTITNKLVDIISAKFRLTKLTIDVKRAFLNILEDELIFVFPPQIWLDAERAAGRIQMSCGRC